MTWVIINHVAELIELSHEPPVQDFISAIHRNSAASGLFIQAINSRCENVTRVSSVHLFPSHLYNFRPAALKKIYDVFFHLKILVDFFPM